MRLLTTFVCFAFAAFPAERTSASETPVLVHIGGLQLKPGAFLDTIGMTRSEGTADSVSTKFGRIPLTNDSSAETIGSARHSRLMLKGDMAAGGIRFSAYAESDFMNFTAGESAYRWRQYWGAAKIGKWEVLGGRAWSLLRPNRVGTSSDKDVMNTDVIDPAYHVGLLGSRTRQIRLARAMGAYTAAVAWEGEGNLVSKVVRDKNRQHYELAGFGGRFGRRGATVSAVLGVTNRLRVVTQQYWSKRAAYQALGVVPTGVNGVSTLEGVEARVSKNLELYSYGGIVYAARANSAANRLVRQWTIGLNERVPMPSLRASLLMSLQYSHVDRSIWEGRSGAMDFLMYRVRYTFN